MVGCGCGWVAWKCCECWNCDIVFLRRRSQIEGVTTGESGAVRRLLMLLLLLLGVVRCVRRTRRQHVWRASECAAAWQRGGELVGARRQSGGSAMPLNGRPAHGAGLECAGRRRGTSTDPGTTLGRRTEPAWCATRDDEHGACRRQGALIVQGTYATVVWSGRSREVLAQADGSAMSQRRSRELRAFGTCDRCAYVCVCVWFAVQAGGGMDLSPRHGFARTGVTTAGGARRARATLSRQQPSACGGRST